MKYIKVMAFVFKCLTMGLMVIGPVPELLGIIIFTVTWVMTSFFVFIIVRMFRTVWIIKKAKYQNFK